jgi:type IV secretion system protein VirB9
VVTDRRTHTFRFVVLPDGDDATPIYRLVIHAPPVRKVAPPVLAIPALTVPPRVSPKDVVAERLKAAPEVLNSDYSIAEGKASDDIVPTLVFDDGRFTYFRFPGNRQIPAVFDVLGDGSETILNTRMEGDVLVVDRVSRRLMLRAGSAVVGVWNDDFDLQGRPPMAGATVPGVQRLLRLEQDLGGAVQARSGVTR